MNTVPYPKKLNNFLVYSSPSHLSSCRTNLRRKRKRCQPSQVPGHRISPSGGILDQALWSTSQWTSNCSRTNLDHNKDGQERCRNVHLYRYQRHGYITCHDCFDSQRSASVYSQAAREDWTIPRTVSHTELFRGRTPSTQHHLDTMQRKHSWGTFSNRRRTTEDKQFDGKRQWYLYLLCTERVRSCGDWGATDC